MNKKRIDSYTPKAILALEKIGIAKNNEIVGNYRATISTFGVCITLGSLKSAVAFLKNENDQSDADRSALLQAICYVIFDQFMSTEEIFNMVCNSKNEKELKSLFVDAAIAIKQAMNIYSLKG